MRAVVAIIAAGLLALAGVWLGTEQVAAHLPARVTAPLLVAAAQESGHGVHVPWGWLLWSREWQARAPGAFRAAGAMTMLGAALGAALAIGIVRVRRSREPSRGFGSARWATRSELRRAGLLADRGVVLAQTADATFDTRVGRDGRTIVKERRLGTLVRHDGPEHVVCFAPTGSGKGVGLVVPTLLTWPDSVVVFDVKKENWELTAGWRKQFSRVLRFEPTALDSVRFNPLLEVRRGLSEVRDVQNVADILIDPTGEKEIRDHWQLTAHSLLCAAILHVLYAHPDKTLSGVGAFLSNPARKHRETLFVMMHTAHLPDGPHPLVAEVAREMLNKSDNELSGVYSTAMTCLGLYRDPVIARSTSESDFRIEDLVLADAPVSLYLVVPPSDLSRTRPIIRLILNQIGRRLTESVKSEGRPRRRLLLLLDEFPTLGRLDFFESALAFVRGYGIKAVLVVQSLNQLEKAYGAHSSILDNCGVRVTYAANDDATARRISNLLGRATETRVQRSRSGSGMILSNRSESEQEHGRELLTPGEVMQLPADDALVLVGGLPPYRARKVRYFLDARLRERAKLPAPDRPDEQARELPPRRPTEWEGLVVAEPAVPRIVEGPVDEDPVAGETGGGGASPGGAEDEGAGQVEALWRETLAKSEAPPAPTKRGKPPREPAPV